MSLTQKDIKLAADRAAVYPTGYGWRYFSGIISDVRDAIAITNKLAQDPTTAEFG